MSSGAAAVLVGVFGVSVFLPRADSDEGLFLVAIRSVVHGQTPYRDFFFPQLPGLPYVYAAWAKVFGVSWYSTRLLSAALAVLCGLVLASCLRRRFGGRIALGGTLLFCLSVYAAYWLPLVKTYALSTLLLVAAYAVFSRAENVGVGKTTSYLGAGALIGLAGDTRLYLWGVLPVFLIDIYISHRDHDYPRRMAALITGVVLGALPTVVFLVLTPSQTLYDTLLFQLVRTGKGGFDLHQKLHVIRVGLGLARSETSAGSQVGLLILANAMLGVVVLRRRRRLPLATMVAAVILLVSLLPTPAYAQYFVVAVPFLIIGLFEAFAVLDDATADARRPRRRRWRALGCVALFVYAIGFPLGLRGAYRGAPEWRLSQIRAVARAVDAATGPNEPVLTLWPGYVVGSHARMLPGLENPYGLIAGDKVSASRAREYHVISSAQVLRLIRRGHTRVVVVGNHTAQFFKLDEYRAALIAGKYRLANSIGATEVWVTGAPRSGQMH